MGKFKNLKPRLVLKNPWIKTLKLSTLSIGFSISEK